MRALFARAFAGMMVATTVTAQSPQWPQRSAEPVVVLGEGGPSDAFAGISGVLAARDGRFFVLDSRPCTVRAYDASGKLIRRLGSPGTGDGQCQRPIGLAIDDSLVTIRDQGTAPGDLGRLVPFTLDGKARKATKIAADANTTRALRGGTTMRYQYDRNTRAGTWHVRASGATQEDSLATLTLDLVDVTRSGVAGTGTSGFGASGSTAFSGDSLFIHADGHTGTVTWYTIDASGAKKSRTESLDRDPTETTDADIAARVAQMEAQPMMQRGGGPPQRPAPGSITMTNVPKKWSVATVVMVSTNGSVWVGAPRRSAPGAADATFVDYAVFPINGSPYRVSLPTGFFITSIVGNRAYGYEIIRTGVVRVYEVR